MTGTTPTASSRALLAGGARTVRRRRRALASLAAIALALVAPIGAQAARGDDVPGCAAARSGEQCQDGLGRQTPGGGEKVPHTGWPRITGVLWKVTDEGRAPRHFVGTGANDELLGHHGSDVLAGTAGDDVLWGDWDPSGQPTAQRDVLRGQAGDDWLYPSHGSTVVDAGPGDDHVWAYYGTGSIDCGPGEDTARVRENGAFRVRNCEHVQHFCSFGASADGSCRQPGSPRMRARRGGPVRGW